MKIKQWIDQYKRKLLILVAAGVFFLSVGHHAFKFWEKSALTMAGLFVVFVPVLAWGLFHAIKRMHPRFNEITRGRLIVLLVPTILLSIAITWFYYRVPTSYHVITITPIVSQNQKVELVEVKSNGSIMPRDEKKALESGWQVNGETLVATNGSQPLQVSFRAPTDTSLTLLFYTSPEGGRARVSFEGRQTQIDLNTPENRQTTSTFFVRDYRGIPDWIFNPLLIAMDILTLGSLFLTIFFLQEMGQSVIARSGSSTEQPPGRYTGLVILLTISIILHVINALAVPLTLYSDSPSYLEGAVHWLQFGNLDIPMLRGPGSTFLFVPILYFFGRNPWGMKIFLHVIAIACVPLSYRLGWQLGKNQWVAFASGLLAVLTPDIFFYSDVVMSDLPNMFLVLLFCTVMISALETFRFRWVIAAMLVASFATLLRTENLLVLVIAFLSLGLSYLWPWQSRAAKDLVQALGKIGLALIVGLLPLLWWSIHNQKVSGFFGLSNYAGAVIYDGWNYFGDASGLSFTDPGSPAVQKINMAIEQYPIVITDASGVATSWEVYSSLMKAGYTSQQAFDLLGSAARDSLKKDPGLDFQLLILKLQEGLNPGPASPPMITLPLPGEHYPTHKMGYFDEENLSITVLIKLQRAVYEYLQRWDYSVYPNWIYLCIYAMIFSLYRSPKAIWITIVVVTATRIFIPNILDLSHWRYTLAGLIPLQIFAINWIAAMIHGVSSLKADHNTLREPS